MNDINLPPDFVDFIKALNEAKVKYILVGGYSVILHGYSRSTMDMDIWVERTEENYKKILIAFQLFKMPFFDMTADNFLKNDNMDVFSFGRPPICIDLLNKVKGLDFKSAWNSKIEKTVSDIKIHVIDKSSLIKAKKAAGRNKDLDDIDHL